jgi:hypothetical protein
MGIPGLTKFVNQRFNRWLRVSSKNWDNVVVDGSNLFHELYDGECTWLLGGEYKWFSDRVKRFFVDLKTHFKEPIVVLDSGSFRCGKMKERHSPQELDNRMTKMRDLQDQDGWECRPRRILGTSHMLIAVLKDVLRDLGISLYAVESDADGVIAGLANHYQCPVLSSDSDFFIFPLAEGYIQLEDWQKDKNNARMFNFRRFMEQFSLTERKQCFLIPVKLGNDSLSSTSDLGFEELLCQVSKFSYQEFVDSPDNGIDRENLEKVEKFYSTLSLPPIFQAETFPHSVNAHVAAACRGGTIAGDSSSSNGAANVPGEGCESTTPLPKWVFQEFEKGRFPLYPIKAHHVGFHRLPKTMDVISRKSPWKFSREIRLYLYRFMGLSSCNEIIREDFFPSTKPENGVECKFPLTIENPRTIDDSIFGDCYLANNSVLQDLVLTVLKCHSIPRDVIEGTFNRLEDRWKLPIAATFYWYKNINCETIPEENLLKSLLLSFLACSDVIRPRLPLLHSVTRDTKSRHLEALHTFIQWQCVYYDAMALNYVAREPFPTTSPASLYSGHVAMHCATIVPHEENWMAKIIPTTSAAWELINKFLYLVAGEDEGWSTVDARKH